MKSFDMKTHLEYNFPISEFERSQAASRYNVDNTMGPKELENARALAKNVLQPIRDHYNKSVNITSGYRGPKVNRAVGGSLNSQHMKGEAADFSVSGERHIDVCRWIKDNLEFDQLILEFVDPKRPGSGWVHVSYVSDGSRKNRKEVLTINNSGTKSGLHG